MFTTAQRETPANYIRFASQNPNDIIAHQYRAELMTLLLNSCENAGAIFNAFRDAADKKASLRSTFYTAVHTAFEQIRRVTNGYPLRWNGLMDSIANASVEDATLQKYIRETLLGKTIPILVGPKSTHIELQMASDILTVAGRYKHLADAVTPQSVRPVVLWHLANAKHKFAWAATTLTQLRQTPPFVPVIADIENKHAVHVVGQKLDDDPTQILLVQFDRARHNVEISVMDTSKNGHVHAPRIINIVGKGTSHHDQISDVLLASTDLPKQEWVEPIATDVYYRLG